MLSLDCIACLALSGESSKFISETRIDTKNFFGYILKYARVGRLCLVRAANPCLCNLEIRKQISWLISFYCFAWPSWDYSCSTHTHTSLPRAQHDIKRLFYCQYKTNKTPQMLGANLPRAPFNRIRLPVYKFSAKRSNRKTARDILLL